MHNNRLLGNRNHPHETGSHRPASLPRRISPHTDTVKCHNTQTGVGVRGLVGGVGAHEDEVEDVGAVAEEAGGVAEVEIGEEAREEAVAVRAHRRQQLVRVQQALEELQRVDDVGLHDVDDLQHGAGGRNTGAVRSWRAGAGSAAHSCRPPCASMYVEGRQVWVVACGPSTMRPRRCVAWGQMWRGGWSA